jgi:hypothetical protein
VSRRIVFRRIAQRQYGEWPAYDSTPLYGRTSLAGLESDIRTVSETWFDHDSHDSIKEFVCVLPVAYFRFSAHDRYAGSTRYRMDTLFRVFVLKELHGWEHETALVGYLESRPELHEQLGFETIPDQSTLWRSWHERFTADLRETVETAARTVLIKAQMRVSRFRVSQHESSDTTGTSLVSQNRTIKLLWSRQRRSRTTSAASFSQRSLWSVGTAVRSTRTPTGTCRCISDFVRASLLTRALVASLTSRKDRCTVAFRRGDVQEPHRVRSGFDVDPCRLHGNLSVTYFDLVDHLPFCAVDSFGDQVVDGQIRQRLEHLLGVELPVTQHRFDRNVVLRSTH